MKEKTLRPKEFKSDQQEATQLLPVPKENYNIYFWHYQNLHSLIQQAVLRNMAVLLLILLGVATSFPNLSQKNFIQTSKQMVHIQPDSQNSIRLVFTHQATTSKTQLILYSDKKDDIKSKLREFG